jgi:hypothetical protein
MNKIVILSIIAVVIFSGCTGKTGTENQTNEGKLTVSEGRGAGTDWCKAGSASTFTSNAPDSQGSFNYVIKGLTTYKGKTVCEAEAKVTGSNTESVYYTQYYSQDKKYFAMILKDSSGKILSENEVNNP